MTRGYSEDTLVEQPTIKLLGNLGWKTVNAYHEFDHGDSPLGRETKADVVLTSRLTSAFEKLNPGVPAEAFDQAIKELTRDRSRMSLVAANCEVYDLIKNGVRVKIVNSESGAESDELIRVIDWDEPTNNDFLLCSQFWITGEMYTRRPDLIGFVNGIPLLFIELKAAHKALKNAFDHNLKDYKETIPNLFWYNGIVILSNGSESRIGSVTADWGHFSEWKKINSEGEKGIVSLETMLRGTCDPARFLDLIENFTVFMSGKGGQVKLVAKNHQYLGVINAIEAFKGMKENQGRLGVFWHTQGSGKSVSMIFFAQKLLRKIPGSWTFVVVTDRQELDKQIYKNFVNAGVITENQAQATSGAHLQQLLKEDHRYVFTLIHKFHTERGEKYPKLTDRSDIIVITDEAHRSQYDTMALNMRNALPNAAFLAFTGTPLIVGEERTKQVFGDYVSIYDFKQSVADGATVPLYYEDRIPKLQLTNKDLNLDMEDLLEQAELDEDQERKVEREFAREYHLITRDDRLEKVAEDLVQHFMGRGTQGKAMVVCIDKATAVKMYDRVQKYWIQYEDQLKAQFEMVSEEEGKEIEDKYLFMKETDMAVVVSQAQNEGEDLRKKGADIIPHRRRMVEEDLDTKFKDPADPLRIVFVCAMWMTGFDVPCCSTLYLDKPMRNHTLMQTIARANRVFPDKVNGLIVDYVGVFRNLQEALAIYGSGPGGEGGETPVQPKEELIEHLKHKIEEAKQFCMGKGVDINKIISASGFDKIRMVDDAVEAIIVNDDSKKQFRSLAGDVTRLFKAILPDSRANEFSAVAATLKVISEKIFPPKEVDISEAMEEVEELLDSSIAADGYEIKEQGDDYLIDLSKINFEALKKKFETGRKRTEAEKLRRMIHGKLLKMVKANRSRMDFLLKFQQMIEDYNLGRASIEEFFRRLMEFIENLNEEEKRGMREELSEEELAVFDLITKPEMKLTKKEEKEVKLVAKDLLQTLKNERIVLDWRKRQQSRAAVRLCIEEILDRLPKVFNRGIFSKKCELVFQHIYEAYFGPGRNIYATFSVQGDN